MVLNILKEVRGHPVVTRGKSVPGEAPGAGQARARTAPSVKAARGQGQPWGGRP